VDPPGKVNIGQAGVTGGLPRPTESKRKDFCCHREKLKNSRTARLWWLIPVILATQEAEIKGGDVVGCLSIKEAEIRSK
jgi:hypothetical protein